ncbi:MAG: hypothetical protein O7B99_08970 [Planctomycetota bacterium]|nr:hypothetical protein [Planctomycetota bacterium]
MEDATFAMKTPAALLALVLLAGCSSGPKEPDPEKLLDLYMTTATYLYQDESYVRAQDQAVKALKIDPQNEPMRKMIGWIRLRMGRVEDLLIAEDFFEQLSREDPSNAAVLLGLASSQERLGVAYDEAAREITSDERYTEAVDPEARSADLFERSRAYWRRSKANYEKVLSGPTAKIKAMNGLQRVAALLGDYDESLTWSKRLLESSRAELAGWRNTMRSRDLTDTEERVARRSEEAAIELQVDTHLFASTMLRKLGRNDEALVHMDGAIALTPNEPQVYSLRAQLRSDVGDHAGGIEDIDRYLRYSQEEFAHPNIRRAYDLRTFCEREMERLAREKFLEAASADN